MTFSARLIALGMLACAVIGALAWRLSLMPRELDSENSLPVHSILNAAPRPSGPAKVIDHPEPVPNGDSAPRPADEYSDGEPRIEDEAVIRGRIYGADSGIGIPGATVVVDSPDSTQASRLEVATASDGAYEVRGLAGGAYALLPKRVPGYPEVSYEATRRVEVSPGGAVEGIDFSIERGLIVRGRVVDQDGIGIARATVVTMAGTIAGAFMEVQTDGGGAFELAGFGPGEVHVQARKEGHKAGSVGPLEMTDAGLDGVEIVLYREASVAGIVVDKNGRPVAHAPLEIRTDEARVLANKRSEADGSFRFGGLDGGSYQLLVDRLGEGLAGGKLAKSVTLQPGEDLRDIRLSYDFELGGTISGRVTNLQGEPVEGARVGGSYPEDQLVGAETGSDGRYILREIRGGPVHVSAGHPDFGYAKIDAVVGAENADLRLQGVGVIAGRVVDARTGDAIAAFELAHHPGEGSEEIGDYAYETIENETGEFLIDSVRPGTNSVHAQAKGFLSTWIDVPNVQAGETRKGVELRLDPAAAIEGIVTDSRGKPISGARVFDWWRQGSFRLDSAWSATTDYDGKFYIDTLSPLVTEIWATHQDYLDGSVAVSLIPGQSSEVTIVLRDGGVIEGVVRVGGVPAAGFGVSTDDRASMTWRRAASTDSNGAYRIAGIAPGIVKVGAYTESGMGERARSKTVETEIADGGTTLVNFDFGESNAVLEGTITRAGEPIAGARVSVMIASPSGGGEEAWARTDDSGYYRIDQLPAGEVTVVASSDTSSEMRRTGTSLVADQATRLDFDFGGGGRIEVVTFGLNPDRGNEVLLLAAGTRIDARIASEEYAQLRKCCLLGRAPIDDSGVANFEGVEPGDYIVYALSFAPVSESIEESYANTRTGFAEVSVIEGESTLVELTIR